VNCGEAAEVQRLRSQIVIIKRGRVRHLKQTGVFTRPAPDAKVVGWLTANEGDFAVDSIILGEPRIGILSLAPGRKRSQLERWFADVVDTIDCLPWDAAVSRRQWGGSK
jgi:hypothetical protein